MEPDQYRLLYESEDRHWWFTGMRAITDAWLEPVLAELAAARRPLDILDAGCGTGAQAAHMAAWGRVTAVDASPLALGYTHRRGLTRLARATVTALPLADASFDLLTGLDILYHANVADDLVALREFARVLRPGGYACIREAAYLWMYSEHDVQVHTVRRYTRGRLAERVRAAGLTVRRLSYANTLLFPAMAAYRMVPRVWGARSSATEVAVPAPWLNGVLARVLSAERLWLRRVRGAGPLAAPFGSSIVCLAQK